MATLWFSEAGCVNRSTFIKESVDGRPYLLALASILDSSDKPGAVQAAEQCRAAAERETTDSVIKDNYYVLEKALKVANVAIAIDASFIKGLMSGSQHGTRLVLAMYKLVSKPPVPVSLPVSEPSEPVKKIRKVKRVKRKKKKEITPIPPPEQPVVPPEQPVVPPEQHVINDMMVENDHDGIDIGPPSSGVKWEREEEVDGWWEEEERRMEEEKKKREEESVWEEERKRVEAAKRGEEEEERREREERRREQERREREEEMREQQRREEERREEERREEERREEERREQERREEERREEERREEERREEERRKEEKREEQEEKRTKIQASQALLAAIKSEQEHMETVEHTFQQLQNDFDGISENNVDSLNHDSVTILEEEISRLQNAHQREIEQLQNVIHELREQLENERLMHNTEMLALKQSFEDEKKLEQVTSPSSDSMRGGNLARISAEAMGSNARAMMRLSQERGTLESSQMLNSLTTALAQSGDQANWSTPVTTPNQPSEKPSESRWGKPVPLDQVFHGEASTPSPRPSTPVQSSPISSEKKEEWFWAETEAEKPAKEEKEADQFFQAGASAFSQAEAKLRGIPVGSPEYERVSRELSKKKREYLARGERMRQRQERLKSTPSVVRHPTASNDKPAVPISSGPPVPISAEKEKKKHVFGAPRSNLSLVRNALRTMFFAGKPNEKDLHEITLVLENAAKDGYHQFIVLVKSHLDLRFNGLYAVNSDTGVVEKIGGNGPTNMPESRIIQCYKYVSNKRTLEPIQTTTISTTTDAVALSRKVKK